MSDSPGLAELTAPVRDALTSGTAFAVYGSVVAAAVLIGVAAKLGPRLWRFFWRYQPVEVDSALMADYETARGERDEEVARWRWEGSMGVFSHEKDYAEHCASSLPGDTLARYRNDPS